MEKYNKTIERYREELEGWGFDLSSTKSPRAFSTKVSNESTTIHPTNDN